MKKSRLAGSNSRPNVSEGYEVPLSYRGDRYIVKRMVLMSIIVPSNHTRIGAWVNSKMSGRNLLVYCTNPLTVMQGYHTNTEDTGS